MNKQTLLNKAAPAALMALMLGTALAQGNPQPLVVDRLTSAQQGQQTEANDLSTGVVSTAHIGN
ncbi:MAG: hypothetical protein Q7U82_16850 [Gammaproteobacteria bacterium]|nr:hypothetical protein [Gammaproteobacteria bacterium]